MLRCSGPVLVYYCIFMFGDLEAGGFLKDPVKFIDLTLAVADFGYPG